MKGSIYCSALASISTSSNWNKCLKGSFHWQFYKSHLWHVLLGYIRGWSTAGIVISMGIRVLEPVVAIHGLVVFPLLDNQKYFNFLETENFTSCNTLTLSEPMLWTSPRIWKYFFIKNVVTVSGTDLVVWDNTEPEIEHHQCPDCSDDSNTDCGGLNELIVNLILNK